MNHELGVADLSPLDLKLLPFSLRIETCSLKRTATDAGTQYELEAPIWVTGSKTGEPIRLTFSSDLLIEPFDNKEFARKWVFDELVGYARHEVAECLRRTSGEFLLDPHPKGESPLLREAPLPRDIPLPITAAPEPVTRPWNWLEFGLMAVAITLAFFLGFAVRGAQ
jgi:hypothetical protein